MNISVLAAAVVCLTLTQDEEPARCVQVHDAHTPVTHLSRAERVNRTASAIAELLRAAPSVSRYRSLALHNFNWADLPERLFEHLQIPVTKLNLSNNSLSTISAAVLASLSRLGLRGLVLKFNKLSRVPETLWQHLQLRVLVVDHNRITRLAALGSVPSRLAVLLASNNDITHIEPGFAPPTLQQLSLANNSLTTLNTSIRHLDKLEYVLLTNNSLMSLDSQLPPQLPGIFVAHNNLLHLPEDPLMRMRHVSAAHNLLRKIGGRRLQMPELEHLDLSHNKLLKLGVEDVSGLSSLQHLLLAGNNITTVEPILCSLCYLRSLDLSFNHITSMKFLTHRRNSTPENSTCCEPSLTDLNLSNNRISALIGVRISCLRTLDVSFNLISHVSRDHLTDLEDLVKLNLAGNRISTVDIWPASLVSHSPSRLCTGDNQCSPLSNSTQIIDTMRLSSLTSLDLSGNNAITRLRVSSLLLPALCGHDEDGELARPLMWDSSRNQWLCTPGSLPANMRPTIRLEKESTTEVHREDGVE